MPKLPLISTDAHVAVPLSLADELPAKYRKKAPHLDPRADGVYFVRPQPLIRMGDELADEPNMMTKMLSDGIKVDDPDDQDMLARLEYGNVTPEATPGWTVERRIEQMELDGVVGEVLIGPGGFGSLSDPDADLAWAQLQNDWLADTFHDHYDKFAPGINLPLSSVDNCVKELERAAGLGLRPGLFPDSIVDKPYNDPIWEPVWEAANSLEVPLAFHLAGLRGYAMPWRRLRPQAEWGRGEGLTGFAIIAGAVVETICWFVCGGILEKYPKLQIVMTETMAGQLGWLMGFLDHYWGARFSRADEGIKAMMGDMFKLTEEPPSAYIKRQVKCTFTHDPSAILQRHMTGLDCLMWANDYPHVEGIWPNSQSVVEEEFAGVPDEEVMQIVHDNAAKVYGLTV